MPMMLYTCPGCDYTVEELVPHPAPDAIACVQCGKPAERHHVYLIAKTPGRWGDQTGKYGVNGYYDKGLGATYHSSMEREKIMKAKGLVSLEDYGKHMWEDETEKRVAKAQAQHDLAERFDAAKAKYGDDHGKVYEEAMPAEKCLAGDYDNLFTAE
jgi:hypothetical protein